MVAAEGLDSGSSLPAGRQARKDSQVWSPLKMNKGILTVECFDFWLSLERQSGLDILSYMKFIDVIIMMNQKMKIKQMSILRAIAYKLRGVILNFKQSPKVVYEWDLYLTLL